MRYVSVCVTFSVLLIIAFTAPIHGEINDNERDEVVGLFGTLLTPSIFTTANSEKWGILAYGRTLTAEGEVPDFDGEIRGTKDIREEIDELSIFAGARIGGLGVTLGFGEGSDFEFSQPFILSLDYKARLLKDDSDVDAAVDFQYSVIVLPEEENIHLSALGFGVFSITGMLGIKVLHIFEPYAEVTLNYVYMNSEEDKIRVWKPIPKVGIQIKILPPIRIGTEIGFIRNVELESAWMWDLGLCAKF